MSARIALVPTSNGGSRVVRVLFGFVVASCVVFALTSCESDPVGQASADLNTGSGTESGEAGSGSGGGDGNDDSGSGGGSSAAGNDGCFDPDAYRVGSTSTLTYRRLDTSGNIVSDYTVESEVTRNTQFEGQPAAESEIQTTTGTSEGTTTGLPYWEYAQVDEGSKTVRFLGFISESPSSNGGQRTITRFDPPITFDYDMTPGESRTQRFTTHTRTEEPPGQTTGTTMSPEQELTFTYVGRTGVTVPAGTFETCQMEHMQGSFRSTQYDHVGRGFMVRWDHPQGRDELVEAIVDGRRVQ